MVKTIAREANVDIPPNLLNKYKNRDITIIANPDLLEYIFIVARSCRILQIKNKVTGIMRKPWE
jgi:hypothetical protein